MASPAIRGILPVINETIGDGLTEILQHTEIGEVSVPVSGKNRMQGVMEVVVPLGIEAVSAFGARPDHTNIIKVALGNDSGLAARSSASRWQASASSSRMCFALKSKIA